MTQATKPGAMRGAVLRTWGPERLCAEPGCITTLSRYNRATRCYAHIQPVTLSATDRAKLGDSLERTRETKKVNNERRRSAEPLRRLDGKHGTMKGYGGGCGCPPCAVAMRDYARERRAQEAAAWA